MSVADIALTDFYSRIIVNDTGRLNLTDVFRPVPEGQPAAVPETSADPETQKMQIRVDTVTLQAGSVAFSDYFTKPNFTAGMKQITGSVRGLSSRPDTRAKIHLKGIHGNSSPLDIVGDINPLADRTFADIDITFNDIELSHFTPYSSKYLGYKIEKGKLILDLEYKIDGMKLVSENRVRFDNFTLGDRVQSEHATSLPVGLAVSLLKNRDGQIDLDLPITGELDDPEFKIGSVVIKMLTNLILKVVTSPFAVIGSMFGGGEDLGYAAYEFGERHLRGVTSKKLDTLAQALKEKPSVRLEIQGSYDPVEDARALKLKAYEDLLKARKLKQMAAQGRDPGRLEDIVILDDERTFLVLSVYEDAAFPKPRDETGVEKTLIPSEKEKLLITNIRITDDDLRLLAMDRSKAVKAYLVSNGGIESKRIFLLEPKASENSEARDNARVTFLLK